MPSGRPSPSRSAVQQHHDGPSPRLAQEQVAVGGEAQEARVRAVRRRREPSRSPSGSAHPLADRIAISAAAALTPPRPRRRWRRGAFTAKRSGSSRLQAPTSQRDHDCREPELGFGSWPPRGDPARRPVGSAEPVNPESPQGPYGLDFPTGRVDEAAAPSCTTTMRSRRNVAMPSTIRKGDLVQVITWRGSRQAGARHRARRRVGRRVRVEKVRVQKRHLKPGAAAAPARAGSSSRRASSTPPT